MEYGNNISVSSVYSKSLVELEKIKNWRKINQISKLGILMQNYVKLASF